MNSQATQKRSNNMQREDNEDVHSESAEAYHAWLQCLLELSHAACALGMHDQLPALLVHIPESL
jgi:hypothetical protein